MLLLCSSLILALLAFAWLILYCMCGGFALFHEPDIPTIAKFFLFICAIVVFVLHGKFCIRHFKKHGITDKKSLIIKTAVLMASSAACIAITILLMHLTAII
jgi:hypothetical protein